MTDTVAQTEAPALPPEPPDESYVLVRNISRDDRPLLALFRRSGGFWQRDGDGAPAWWHELVEWDEQHQPVQMTTVAHLAEVQAERDKAFRQARVMAAASNRFQRKLAEHECVPTQWAYDQACKALHRHRDRADTAEVVAERMRPVVEAAKALREAQRRDVIDRPITPDDLLARVAEFGPIHEAFAAAVDAYEEQS